MESYEQGYEADRFENDVSQNYHCPICLNVFRQPVMCQRNQHLFCLPCITRHLTNSQTCPSCLEGLTLETLTQAPRIVTGCLSELNIRCDYFNRGCRELVQLGDLESHVKDCGFTPVVCSNEGCLVEINKRDRTHHETEICEFRKVKCHNCDEMSKEMDEVKMNLKAVNDKLSKLDEMEDIKKNLKAVNDKLIKLDEMEDIKNNLTEINEQLATLPDQIRGIQTVQEKMMKESKEVKHEATTVTHSVVVAGGCYQARDLNSVEMFDWSKRSWVPLQSMKKYRNGASSFIYKSRFTVTGGWTDHGLTDSMESMAINPALDSTQWCDFPAKLPSKLARHSNVVYNGRLIVIGGYDGRKYSDSIHEVPLDPPYTPKSLTRLSEPKAYAGVELFNDRALIVGGRKSDHHKDLQHISEVIVHVTKNIFIQENSVKDAFIQHIQTKKKQDSMEQMRDLKSTAGFHLSFSLINDEPETGILSWNIKKAITETLQPLLTKISHFDISVDSQILYYSGVTLHPKVDGEINYLTTDDLPHMINPIEAKLGSFVSLNPSLNFIVFVPPREQTPLKIRNNDGVYSPSNAFLSPRWGGVLIHNIYNRSEVAGSAPKTIAVDVSSMMKVFLSQVRLLIGIKPMHSEKGVVVTSVVNSGARDWEVDNLMLTKTMEYLSTSIKTLTSLTQLIDKVKNMVIDDNIKAEIEQAVDAIKQCQDEIARGDVVQAFLNAKQAIQSSEKAFFDPSVLELLYFPDDQKFAIYIPLFLPISLPLLVSLFAAIQWLRNKDDKNESKEQEKQSQ